MGAIGGLLGTSGGAGGSGFSGPNVNYGASINPFNDQTPGQIKTAYTDNREALKSQQQLIAALQAQHGLQNQSNVYNQLQGVVSGTGPNPAQAMLNQATGQNVANQAALMAGQRGANQNVGLLARQAAQQGANTQQQAVGQAANLQAEQSLNALNGAGTISGNQAANQINATQQNVVGQQNEQSMLLNALTGYNSTNAGLQANINSSNASLANTTMQGQQPLIGGMLNKLPIVGQMFGAEGGEVQRFEDGGQVQSMVSSPQSSFVQYLNANAQMPEYGGSPDAPAEGYGTKQLKEKLEKNKSPMSSIPGVSGSSGALPGESADTFSQAPMAGGAMDAGGGAGLATAALVSQGGMMTHDYRGGGNVKAKNASQKAVASGNSYANDKIPAVLSEGEVVIPRSVMQSKDPISASAKFVQDVMAKRKMRG